MSKRASKEYFSLKSDLAYEEEEQRCVKDIFYLFFQLKGRGIFFAILILSRVKVNDFLEARTGGNTISRHCWLHGL
jgi:hypothetical protein